MYEELSNKHRGKMQQAKLCLENFYGRDQHRLRSYFSAIRNVENRRQIFNDHNERMNGEDF
jgi:hypothetical protein